MRQEADESAQFQITHADLQNPSQNRGRKQILDSMFANESAHQQRHRAGSRRDHARPPAGERNHDSDTKGSVQPDHGAHAGQNRERNRLRDQGKSYRQTGQHITSGVGKPNSFYIQMMKQVKIPLFLKSQTGPVQRATS
ncbi:hypothetical protein D3C74_331510 [compost metagenome]